MTEFENCLKDVNLSSDSTDLIRILNSVSPVSVFILLEYFVGLIKPVKWILMYQDTNENLKLL